MMKLSLINVLYNISIVTGSGLSCGIGFFIFDSTKFNLFILQKHIYQIKYLRY